MQGSGLRDKLLFVSISVQKRERYMIEWARSRVVCDASDNVVALHIHFSAALDLGSCSVLLDRIPISPNNNMRIRTRLGTSCLITHYEHVHMRICAHANMRTCEHSHTGAHTAARRREANAHLHEHKTNNSHNHTNIQSTSQPLNNLSTLLIINNLIGCYSFFIVNTTSNCYLTPSINVTDEDANNVCRRLYDEGKRCDERVYSHFSWF